MQRSRFGDQHRGRHIEPKAAVLLRNFDRQQAHVRGFAQQRGNQSLFLCFDVTRAWQHLTLKKIERGLVEHALIVSELLRRENRALTAFFDEK